MATTQQEYDALVNRIVAEGQMRDFEALAASLSQQQPRAQQPTGMRQPPSLPGAEVLDRNVYNMTGSRDAHERYGVPPVLVQSDPFARIAYNVGLGGSVSPMVGYPSVYPHVLNGVVERGMPAYLDQVAAYRNSLLPYMGQLMQVMQPTPQTQRIAGGGGSGGSGAGGAGRAAAAQPRSNTAPAARPNMLPLAQQLLNAVPAPANPDLMPLAQTLLNAIPPQSNYNPWEQYPITGEAPVPTTQLAEQAPIMLDPWVLGEAENDIQGTEEILGRATPAPMDVGPNIGDIYRMALAQKIVPLAQLGQMDIPQTFSDMIQGAMTKITPLVQALSSTNHSPAPVMPPQTQVGFPELLAPTPEDMVFNVPVIPSLNNLFRGAALGRMMSGGY